ncbi:hypothetical protein KTJ89_12440 [Brevibacterium sediminis]|uniref:fibronectin-binding protein FnbA n=1 Tax=Brevibacterium sediminis TaxID=1857024 RepID=UPI002174E7A4|nr:hypothetical protein [Brevibacterium sediminis]MCS4593788.1 hypothetical protein [Brevibacterium sediminis]
MLDTDLKNDDPNYPGLMTDLDGNPAHFSNGGYIEEVTPRIGGKGIFELNHFYNGSQSNDTQTQVWRLPFATDRALKNIKITVDLPEELNGVTAIFDAESTNSRMKAWGGSYANYDWKQRATASDNGDGSWTVEVPDLGRREATVFQFTLPFNVPLKETDQFVASAELTAEATGEKCGYNEDEVPEPKPSDGLDVCQVEYLGRTIWNINDGDITVRDKYYNGETSDKQGEINADGWGMPVHPKAGDKPTMRLYGATKVDLENVTTDVSIVSGGKFVADGAPAIASPAHGQLQNNGYTVPVGQASMSVSADRATGTIGSMPANSSYSFNATVELDGTNPIVLLHRLTGTRPGCDPQQPDPKVSTTEWTVTNKDCESRTVTESREVTTTEYVFDPDTLEWVEGESTTSTETRDREMTADELAECEAADDDAAADSDEADTAADSDEADTAADSDKADTAADSNESDTAANSDEADTAADSDEADTAADSAQADTAADSSESDTAADSDKADTAADSDEADTAADSNESDTAADSDKADTAADSDKADTAADSNESDTATDSNESDTAADSDEADTAADSNESDTAADSDKADTAADSNESDTAADSDKADTAADSNEADTAADSAQADTAADSDKADAAADSDEADSAANSNEADTAADSDKADTAADSNEADTAADSNEADTAADSNESDTAADSDKADAAADSDEADTTADSNEADTAADSDKADTAADSDKADTAADSDEADTAADSDKADTAADSAQADTAADSAQADTAADSDKADAAADSSESDTAADTAVDGAASSAAADSDGARADQAAHADAGASVGTDGANRGSEGSDDGGSSGGDLPRTGSAGIPLYLGLAGALILTGGLTVVLINRRRSDLD